MSRVSVIALLFCLAIALPCISWAQEPTGYNIEPISKFIPGAPPGSVGFDPATGTEHFTNMLVQYSGTTLMADSVSVNPDTGDAIAIGNVRIEQASEMWIGDRITYNFKTHVLVSGNFRTGRPPYFGRGEKVEGNSTNRTYGAEHFYVTSDNVPEPDYYIQASRMNIVPGKYVEAWNAVLYVEGVPIFYYPYFRHKLGIRQNTFTVMPGDDSLYGPYLYGTYTWWIDEKADGKIHLDYRGKRGPGIGPDLNLHLGQWGEAEMKYYYTHDRNPEESVSTNSFQNLGRIPENRQMFYLGWQATPYTNFNTKALVNYQSDQLVLHDFFQSAYGQNPQPNTFVEANKYWNNWSLDAYTTPRINSFFDQVERLPQVQFDGFRQQIFKTPVYYESQSSIGYYDSYFAGTNTLFGPTNNTPADYAAPRADTYQQLLMPETFFGWLDVTPRAGGRVTWYGPESGPGGTNAEVTRYVFNTGVDVSFKASQLWPDATNSLLDINGLRHIIVPSVTYAYVPQPSVPVSRVPQFDTQLPSLMVLPVEFPDYNDIDAIQSENVVRFGIRNTLQTKRDGELDSLLDWNLMLDWNLHPNGQTNSVFMQPQQTFDDLYSALLFKPRSWIELESQVRYDINNDYLNMSFNEVSFTPSDRWSWGIGHWYLRDGFVDSGDNAITSTFFYRLNQNWGFRATHYFNILTGRLQQQNYSIYRDMRSWTAALTFRVIDNGGGQAPDYGVAFSVSLKAAPRYHVGDDAVRPYDLLGQ
jgi:LPS-assembly protein